jgi:hypothetical protein
MEQIMFDGTKVSNWSFRLTGTLLVLMLPIFLVGRFTHLSPQAANMTLGALGMVAGVGVIVGTIAVIWKK